MPFSTLKQLIVLQLALTGAFAQDNPLAKAGPFVPMGSGRATAACAREIAAIHGVWQSAEVYLPLYVDGDTVAYLAALGAKAAGDGHPIAAVLPVYATEALHFRRGDFVFLSTAFIVEAHGEQELIDAIQADFHRGRSKRPVWQLACSTLAPGSSVSLLEIQHNLSVRLAEYARLTTPRLKRRDGPHQPVI